MELKAPLTFATLADTCRLVPTRFPPVGILDEVASPADLELMFELESWTNDRIAAELGLLHRVPVSEWVVGRPMASVIMAPFCHPRPGGGRFNGADRGAWYAGFQLETAHAEVVYHRTVELLEIGVLETRIQMRLYKADFEDEFHDVRAHRKMYQPLYDPLSYTASQSFGQALRHGGSNGILYRSVRHEGGECIACFRPTLVRNVRAGDHFEYRWSGTRVPTITRLPGKAHRKRSSTST